MTTFSYSNQSGFSTTTAATGLAGLGAAGLGVNELERQRNRSYGTQDQDSVDKTRSNNQFDQAAGRDDYGQGGLGATGIDS